MFERRVIEEETVSAAQRRVPGPWSESFPHTGPASCCVWGQRVAPEAVRTPYPLPIVARRASRYPGALGRPGRPRRNKTSGCSAATSGHQSLFANGALPTLWPVCPPLAHPFSCRRFFFPASAILPDHLLSSSGSSGHISRTLRDMSVLAQHPFLPNRLNFWKG